MYELGYWDRIPTAVQVRIGGAKVSDFLVHADANQ